MKSNTIPVLPPFNPLDKRNLAESVTEALIQRPVAPLPPSPFIGAGIYAIYYTGDFPLYCQLARLNSGKRYGQPIYVGKAVPAGARKGGLGLDALPGLALYNRLCDHAKSVSESENLETRDFSCRFLAVDDIWIPLAESLLIERFTPLWNMVLDGFGNHDPGKGRYNQQKSPWDTIHPGRNWASRLQDNANSLGTIQEQVRAFIKEHYVQQ
jgi:hypothetical protein